MRRYVKNGMAVTMLAKGATKSLAAKTGDLNMHAATSASPEVAPAATYTMTVWH